MQKIFMFMLSAVNYILQFGKNGGHIIFEDGRFVFSNPTLTAPVKIVAAEATEGNEVVTLSQLNSQVAVIVSGGINAVTDVPLREGEVRISHILDAGIGLEQGKLYMGINNAGALEWKPLSLLDAQLATFGTKQELPDGSGGFVFRYLDTHVYMWDETTGKFLDNGSLMDAKNSHSVKKQVIIFGPDATLEFKIALPVGVHIHITDIDVAVSRDFDKAEGVTFSFGSGGALVDESEIDFSKPGVYPFKPLGVTSETGEFQLHCDGAGSTTGSGEVVLTYIEMSGSDYIYTNP